MRLPSLLVVDASILFSFFKKDSERAKLLEELSNRGVKLISPEYVMEELFGERYRVMQFSGIDELEFSALFSILDRIIEQFPKFTYERFLQRANKISPHGEGTKDDPYFALALSLNCPIRPDEREFKKQSEVKVFSTKELLERLGFTRFSSAKAP